MTGGVPGCRTGAAVLLALIAIGIPAAGGMLDSFAARVDETVITWSEMVQEGSLARLVHGTEASGPADLVGVIIRRKLLVKAAEKLRLEATRGEVTAQLEAYERAGGGAESFQTQAGLLGLSEEDLRARAREVILAGKYTEVQREAIYVTESEVRSYLSGDAGGPSGELSSSARAEVRAALARMKAEREMEAWIGRQYAAGRVRLVEVDAGRRDAPPEER